MHEQVEQAEEKSQETREDVREGTDRFRRRIDLVFNIRSQRV